MYVTNVVNTCMALNNNYDTTIIQFNFAILFVFRVASLITLLLRIIIQTNIIKYPSAFNSKVIYELSHFSHA